MINRILFFLIGFILLILIIRFTISEKTALENQIQHILETKPKIISIGSSHARTLLPLQSPHFYVIHESGIDLSEIILILNRITIEYEPDSIIICISDYHGYLLNRFYSSERENRIDKFEHVLYSTNSFTFSNFRSSIIAWFRPFLLFKNKLTSNDDTNGKLTSSLFTNTASLKEDQRLAQYNKMQELGFNTETFILNDVKRWVKSTSTSTLIFYTPPFHQSLQSMWFDYETKRFYSTLKHALLPYSNRIFYFNHQFSTKISENQTYYMNSDHLNEFGKKTYIDLLNLLLE